MKYTVGYCDECGENTRQRVIECKDSVAERIFETVVTLGWSLLYSRDYSCECSRCGNINTISKR